MNVTKDIEYVDYIVHKYLEKRRSLSGLREDMIQEGFLALLKARDDYDPSVSSMDEDLFVWYKVSNSLRKVMKQEARHFRRSVDPDEDEESPYWDLDRPISIEDIQSQDKPTDSLRLCSLVGLAGLTTGEEKVLEVFLKHGDYLPAAQELGLSKQYVRQTILSVVAKCKKVPTLSIDNL